MNYKDVINNPKYKEIASVKHNDIKEFVIQEVSYNYGWTRIANTYQIIGLFALGFSLIKALISFYTYKTYISLIVLGIGLLFSFTLLIILHELIHAAAYKYVGAKKLSFGMNIRKFLFYVQADKQVLNYKQFKITALAPAITIAFFSLLGIILFYNRHAFYFFISVFGLHSLFCAGDFGMLCFFQNRPDMDIVTFDIKAKEITYFYGKEKMG